MLYTVYSVLTQRQPQKQDGLAWRGYGGDTDRRLGRLVRPGPGLPLRWAALLCDAAGPTGARVGYPEGSPATRDRLAQSAPG